MTDPRPKLLEQFPEPMVELAAALETHGHSTFWVGEGLAEAAIGRSPSNFSLVTSASAGEIGEALRAAVPCRPGGRAFVVPTPAGPVDLAPLGTGVEIDEHLALRGFRLLAMAWRPTEREWLDPWSGLNDLNSGWLRCVGDPLQTLERVPRRVLQAARLAAKLTLQVDVSIENIMGKLFEEQVQTLPPVDLRYELSQLLSSEDPSAGLELLQRTGVDNTLGLVTSVETVRLIASSPPDLGLRWTIWIRDTSGARSLRKFRIDAHLTKRIQRLHNHHPVEEQLAPGRGKVVRRALSRLGREDCQKLLDLRQQELEGEVGEEAERKKSELRQLAEAVEFEAGKLQEIRPRIQPVLGGQQVMKILKLAPGPRVGTALAYLNRCVNADPTCNTQSSLRTLLLEWAAEPSED